MIQTGGAGRLVSEGVKIQPGGTPAWDLFGRLRVSEPFTLFDSAEVQAADPGLFWDEDTAGSGSIAYNSNQASHTLSVTTASGDRATRQTKRYFRYQPGKSFVILMTGVLGDGQANTDARIGYFDDDNGLFFENAGGSLQFVRRTMTSGSAVDNATAQAEWDDPLDGTGPSRVNIDWAKTQIFWVAFEWLGVGSVQFGVVHEGAFIAAHQLDHNNSLDTVYMSSACLPVRYEVENTGTAAAGYDLDQICAAVFVEGGYNPAGVRVSDDTGDTAVGTKSAGSFYPLLSIRLDSAYIRGTIAPDQMSVTTSGAGDYRWEVRIGNTLTSASWADVGATSIAEADTSATAASGGTVIASGYVVGLSGQSAQITATDLLSDLVLAADKAGVSDILTLGIYAVSDTTVSGATVAWREFR